MEILLKAEKIGEIGGLTVTNTLVASTCVMLFLMVIALFIKKSRYDLKSRFYNFIEMIVDGFMSVIEGVVGRGRVAQQIFSIVVTFFFFIILNNWFGLFPGFGAIGFYEPKHHTEDSGETSEHVVSEEAAGAHNEEAIEGEGNKEAEGGEHGEAPEGGHEGEPEMVFVPLLRSANSDLNMTLAIALVSVMFIQIITIRSVGFKNYIGKFFNFSSVILFFVGLLEIISEIVKIFSFSFRLFGNIFAGDVLLIVISSLVPYIAPIPFMGIEMFAGFIQALIFSMLTLVFVNVSVSHDHS